MGIIVHKYGGSSVSDPDKIKSVARKVHDFKKKHDCGMVVVVSAMGDTTDDLIELAGQISFSPSKREMDQLMATGEQVSIALLAMALENIGSPSISLTGIQAGLEASGSATEGRICYADVSRVIQEIEKGKIPVVAGFQAKNGDDTITLGRGGSDLTAVALAIALEADACHIYTDVQGVFSADPRLVSGAKLLPNVEYGVCMEMATVGAKVLQARSVQLAARYDMPVYVASSAGDKEGTWVMKHEVREGMVVQSICHDRDIAKVAVLGVPDRPGVAAYLFKSLGEKAISTDMIIQSTMRGGVNDIAFIIRKQDLGDAIAQCRIVAKELDAQGVIFDSEVARVTVVGARLANHPELPGRVFSVLAGEGVNLDMITSSSMSISCVVAAPHTDKAVKSLHRHFIEEAEKDELRQ